MKGWIAGRWVAVVMLLGVIGLATLGSPSFHLGIQQTRPFFALLAGVLLLIALRYGYSAYRVWWVHRHRATWRASLRLLGWLPIVTTGAALAMVIVWGEKQVEFNWLRPAQAAEVVIPLALGVWVAFAFSPEDEPGLETLLTYPRPIAWIPLERFACALVILMALGAGVSLATAASLLWLPAGVFFAGLGLYITLSWRVAAFSAMIAGWVWFLSLQFAPQFLPDAPPLFVPLNYIQPFLWGVNPYLRMADVSALDYGLNRLVVLGLGINALILAVGRLGTAEGLLFNTPIHGGEQKQ